MTEHRIITTDAEIDSAIAEARAREHARPRAVNAFYDTANDKVVISLASGIDVAFPRKDLQGLKNATKTQMADVQLEGAGSGLHWPALDVDHYIPGLLDGVFGTRRWMSELGRKGGAVRSAVKAAAARANGRKGGRPRLLALAPRIVAAHRLAAVSRKRVRRPARPRRRAARRG
jgi:hypothetical protein